MLSVVVPSMEAAAYHSAPVTYNCKMFVTKAKLFKDVFTSQCCKHFTVVSYAFNS